jgi:2-polyprenyl-6-methoxyphenol hydroxylase-like FAD-dependent oxidoreductase
MFTVDEHIHHESSLERIKVAVHRDGEAIMRAVIIGAGIAGPALAAFLAKVGIESVICEARERPTGSEGGFLGVAPNGMRVLAELGIDGEVEARGVLCDGFAFQNASGARVGVIDRRQDRARHDARMVMIKRGVLQRVLLDEALRLGTVVHHGTRLVEIDRSDPRLIVARFEDGSEQAGDLVVGCDGLRSRVRSLLFPDQPPPRYSGLLDFGGYAPIVESSLEIGWNVMVFGKRAFFGGFRTPPDEHGQAEVWWFHNGGDAQPIRSLPADERRRRILELHADDPPWIGSCVRATPEILGPWPLHEVVTMRRWHLGRVGVIGDAAHATSPSAGQGASLALEDAMLLARCLRDVGDPDRAFALLERLRRARIDDVVRQSRRNSSYKAPGPIGAWFRDRALPCFIKLGERAQHRAYSFRIDWDEVVAE